MSDGGLGHGADDVAALVLGRQHLLQLGAQGLALFFVLDALRDADVRLLRQIHQQASGETQLRGKARAFGADGVLDDLHQQALSLEQHLLDGLGGIVAVGAVLPDVGDMQEGGALQPDVDERRLHAGQHALHLADIDVADQAALAAALDVQFLHDTLLHHRDAGFLRGDVDQDLFCHGAGYPNSFSNSTVSYSGSPITPV